ncbi:MAG: flagellar hook-basal body complex protein, partial [Thermodesulfobacteriota bacterium]|nr:flagellar hook-basal body complex protein [Thermodesulfobacteriota bacterium]
DIVLQSFTSSPRKTDHLTLITNLDADAANKSNLSTSWDGADANDQYIAENQYEYQTTLKAYDSLGSTHDITIFFDKGSTASTYEYIVTCNPDEDKRVGMGLTANDAGLGMLGTGILTFNQGSGAIENITSQKFIGEAGGLSVTSDFGGTSTATSTVYGEWSGTAALPATYTFTNSTGGDVTVGGASSIALTVGGAGSGTLTIPANYMAGTILGSTAGLPDGIDLSFTAGTIQNGESLSITVTAGDADILTDSNCWATMNTTNDLTNGYYTFSPDFIGGTTTDTALSVKLDFGSSFNNASGSWASDSLSTTMYSSASTTTFQSANGYGAGDLQSVTVGTDGALTGQYSNGQVIPLYRVALAKFQNNQALFKVGGNLFRETRLSGDPTTSKPGTNGLGSLSPNSLEQSNVDIATEFVKMITTQRGFQANSKIITVTDQMLAELINLKR